MLVKARVRLSGASGSYSTESALADSGSRMSLIDAKLADKLGVEYTGRELSFISISGHALRAREAIVRELEVEGELLKSEAVAVAEVPEAVRESLRKAGLDGSVIIGVITLERANLVPNVATGKLEKAPAFML